MSPVRGNPEGPACAKRLCDEATSRTGHEGSLLSKGATVLTKAEIRASDHEPGVVNSTVYARGQKIADVAIEEAGEWSKRPGHVVWIGLFEPSDELLQRVQ